jgi:hypothetical protein
MRIDSCAECARLWREYSTSTADHIRLDNKLGIAALRDEDDAVRLLAPEVEAALMRRSEARRAIQSHETAAHPPRADAAEADATRDHGFYRGRDGEAPS